jgi:hypothetical protein
MRKGKRQNEKMQNEGKAARQPEGSAFFILPFAFLSLVVACRPLASLPAPLAPRPVRH